MLDKKRLLQQLSLPSHLAAPFRVEWMRSKDLFGDHFALRACVDEELIRFDYFHASSERLPETEAPVWSFTIGLSSTGRARVAQSEGVEPTLKTVQRAAALIEAATRQLQTNPKAYPEEAKQRNVSRRTSAAG